MTSVETLERVRRKLETKGEGMAYVRMELLQRTLEDSKKGTEEATRDGDEADRLVKERGLEVWLFSWDEMPESCVALLGEAHDEWHEWGNVRYIHLVFYLSGNDILFQYRVIAAGLGRGRLKPGKARTPLTTFDR